MIPREPIIRTGETREPNSVARFNPHLLRSGDFCLYLTNSFIGDPIFTHV